MHHKPLAILPIKSLSENKVENDTSIAHGIKAVKGYIDIEKNQHSIHLIP